MPEKAMFLTAWNTENIAPVQAGLLFLPEPRTTERSQKRCPKESKSDTEPWKNIPETCPKLHGKIMPRKTGKCRQKTSRRHPRGTQKSSNNPELHLGPPGPIIWPKVPRSSHFIPESSHFIASGYHFASLLEGICDPKAANQASAEAENFSSILHISSRVRGLYFFSRVGGSASHINIIHA